MATSEELTRIHERIDQVGKDLGAKVSTLSEEVVTLRTTLTMNCPSHHQRLTDIETIMHGPPENGSKPGLISQVRVMRLTMLVMGALLLLLVGVKAEALFAKLIGI